MLQKLLIRCLIIAIIGLVLVVRCCSTLVPSTPQLTEVNGLYYEPTPQGYVFYSVNQHPLFGKKTMDNYQELKQGIFQISGNSEYYLYLPTEDNLAGPYSEIKNHKKGFLIKDVNGWGMLNSQLECIIPTEHTETEILRLLN